MIYRRLRLYLPRVLGALLLSLLLYGCRGCSQAPMEFSDLLGTWGIDVDRALKESAEFAKMAPDTQAAERQKLQATADSVRFVYTREKLKITMLLTPEAAARRKADGKLVGRVEILAEDPIIRYHGAEGGLLVLHLGADKEKPRLVHIRRIDKDHIEMVEPEAKAPTSFRFLKRVR